MTTGNSTSYIPNQSRYAPDFFSPIQEGNYGNNYGNTSTYSPSGYGGYDPRNVSRNPLGSSYGYNPDYTSSIGLQSNTYTPDQGNLSFYGSDGTSPTAGSFGLGTGLGGYYFEPPSDINSNPYQTSTGTGSAAKYGSRENVFGSTVNYTPQFGADTTTLQGLNARGGAAKAMIEDNSGTSYADTNYNLSRPTDYNFYNENETPYGLGQSFGRGRITADVGSPNANDFGFDQSNQRNTGGYVNQNIGLGQQSRGLSGSLIGYNPQQQPNLLNSIKNTLTGNRNQPQTPDSISDIAKVGALARNTSEQEALLNMPGSVSSNMQTGSKINAMNQSPIFGNKVGANVDINTGSDINLNTRPGGVAKAYAGSDTIGEGNSSMQQTMQKEQGNPLSKPKYYTFKDQDGSLKVTSDQKVAAQADSFGSVDTNSPDFKSWVSQNVPTSLKDDFSKMQQTLPSVFGNFPDFDSYAAFNYARVNPTSMATVKQNTTADLSNDLAKMSTSGNQYLNVAAGGNSSIGGTLGANAMGYVDPNNMNTQLDTNTQIGAYGDTTGMFQNNNAISASGRGMSTDSRNQSSGFINTGSENNTYIPRSNQYNSGEVGVAPQVPVYGYGSMYNAPIIPRQLNPNINISNSSSNINSLFNPLNGLF